MRQALADEGSRALAVNAFQVHKSLGLSVLVLSLLRLAWRLWHPPGALPAGMPGWERLAARSSHVLFYLLMIGIPLSGWLYVSAQWREGAALNVPTLWFGAFEVPHLFGLHQASAATREVVAAMGLEAHEWLAWTAMGLLVLHVAAALKHHFRDRDDVLSGMLPWQPRNGGKGPARSLLWAGGLAIVLATIAVSMSLFPRSPSAGSGASADIASVPGSWVVDPEQSEISFAGTHAGSPFKGRFGRWTANLDLNAEDPTRSRLSAEIETGSASDGIKLHDETLPQAEWFDVERHPLAYFTSTSVSASDDGSYEVGGELRIKDRVIAVEGMRLRIDGSGAEFGGQLIVTRAQANLGMESDPGGDWVSPEVEVGVQVTASRP